MSARADILGKLGSAEAPPLAARGSSASSVIDIQKFLELAAKTQTTTEQVASVAALPAAIARYMQLHGLDNQLLIDGLAAVPGAAWDVAGLQRLKNPIAADKGVCVSEAYAGIAEFGCVVVSSKMAAELRSAFLAATHIVVLPLDRLVANLESFWHTLRREHPDAEAMPREFCFVNGPSRTGDLGLPAKLGAHGPGRVHVILVAGMQDSFR